MIKIFIKNMVSLRCQILVKSELDKLSIAYASVTLGAAELIKPLSKSDKQLLNENLQKYGLKLMDDKNAILIEKIINIIVEMIHYTDVFPDIKFSTYLSEKMGQNYHKMAEIFSNTKGITIEQFIILHKVEKIKELIIYDELNLTQIAIIMNYSSLPHLCKQFKQVTGLTPTSFKSLSKRKRNNLEDLGHSKTDSSINYTTITSY